MVGKNTALSICVVSIIVISTVVTPVYAEMVYYIPPNLGEDTPAYILTAKDCETRGDKCMEDCKYYTKSGKEERLFGGWSSEWRYYDEITGKNECSKAIAYYNMAIGLMPEDNYEDLARIYSKAGEVYMINGQDEYRDKARDKADEYREAAVAQSVGSSMGIPLSLLTSLFAIVLLAGILLMKGDRRREK